MLRTTPDKTRPPNRALKTMDSCIHPRVCNGPLSCVSQRATRAAAWVRGTLPTVARQRGPNHRCALARELGYVHGPEPEGLRSFPGEVEVVAALVLPHLLVTVKGRPVELDADAVLGVPVVPVVRPPRDLPPGLPLSRGQPVRSLDVAGVPELQSGVNPVVAVPERHGERAPIADAPPGGEGRAEHGGARELPRDGARDPAVGGLEGRRRVDQFQNGVLDPGA